jgi:hypothetical protein
MNVDIKLKYEEAHQLIVIIDDYITILAKDKYVHSDFMANYAQKIFDEISKQLENQVAHEQKP